MLVLLFAVYVSSHGLAAGARYHEVFRYIGATVFMGFALGQIRIPSGTSARGVRR